MESRLEQVVVRFRTLALALVLRFFGFLGIISLGLDIFARVQQTFSP